MELRVIIIIEGEGGGIQGFICLFMDNKTL